MFILKIVCNIMAHPNVPWKHPHHYEWYHAHMCVRSICPNFHFFSFFSYLLDVFENIELSKKEKNINSNEYNNNNNNDKKTLPLYTCFQGSLLFLSALRVMRIYIHVPFIHSFSSVCRLWISFLIIAIIIIMKIIWNVHTHI